ncbi:hypothetical protein DFP72DRAFT_851995 [Ephemerocybe angulata]|uniref:Uncharacterized protein n=1 Tax=Ephemerocybe angulata TaxID=980116 RepID=A0A8H6HQF4_9AGAR|nr:hypothetical protein DFP72DRAFT_851995 [Tulosesus angulatus]
MKVTLPSILLGLLSLSTYASAYLDYNELDARDSTNSLLVERNTVDVPFEPSLRSFLEGAVHAHQRALDDRDDLLEARNPNNIVTVDFFAMLDGAPLPVIPVQTPHVYIGKRPPEPARVSYTPVLHKTGGRAREIEVVKTTLLRLRSSSFQHTRIIIDYIVGHHRYRTDSSSYASQMESRLRADTILFSPPFLTGHHPTLDDDRLSEGKIWAILSAETRMKTAFTSSGLQLRATYCPSIIISSSTQTEIQ